MRRSPIIRLAPGVYCTWSGGADAPAGFWSQADVDDMFAADIEEARQALELAEGAAARLAENGHTFVDADLTPRRVIAGNRAGPNEGTLTYAEIRAAAEVHLAETVFIPRLPCPECGVVTRPNVPYRVNTQTVADQRANLALNLHRAEHHGVPLPHRENPNG